MNFGFWILDFGSNSAAEPAPAVYAAPDRKSKIQNPKSKITAFTAVELIFGILLCSMIGTAVAALSLAVAEGWSQSETGQTSHVTRTQATHHTQQVLRKSKLIGLVRPGKWNDGSATAAAAMLWRGDYNGDEQIQYEEIALLQYNATDDELLLYEVVWPSSAVRTTLNVTLSNSSINDSSAPETFKALAYVEARVLARDVIGAQFTAVTLDSDSQRPALEFVLHFEDDELEYGIGTLRPPATRPS